MIEIYTHELGREYSEDLLLAYGIDARKSNTLLQMTKDKMWQQSINTAKDMSALQRAKQVNLENPSSMVR
jgi:hypothetical protein